jgi:hypothetical protein
MTTDTDDKRITDTYRDLANERTPSNLDEKILAMAASEARTRYGLTRAWIRPVAWAATIGLSLAFILEMSQLTDVPAPAPAVSPAAAPVPTPAGSRLEGAVQPALVPSDAESSDAFAAQDMNLLREAEEQARMRAGEARAAKAIVDEPAAAALQAAGSLEKKESPATHCDDAAHRSADSWYECILQLREKGLVEEAASELEALRDAFPAFREPADP